MTELSKLQQVIKREKRRRAMHLDILCDYDFAHDNGENPAAIQCAKNYADNFDSFARDGAGLFLYGASGSGKTFLAAAIVNELTDRGYRCRFTSMLTIMNTLSAIGYENRRDYLDQFSNAELLVLDDFGIETETSYSNNVLNGIVGKCYEKHVPMIVITPYPQDSLLKETGDSKRNVAVKRLRSRCFPYTVLMPAGRSAKKARKKSENEALIKDGIKPEQQTLAFDGETNSEAKQGKE